MFARRSLFALATCFAVLAFSAAGVAMQPPRAAALPAVAAASLPSTTTPNVYFVKRVVDGDTIDVTLNGTTTRLRLIGIDTPEIVDPRKPVQCFGPEASAEGHKLLDNSWVRLEYDVVAGKTDKYGRTLAYVFLLDGTSYNEFMIRKGFAHEYDYDGQKYEYRAAFRAAQAEAKHEQLGLWSPSTCNGDTTRPAVNS